MKKITLGFLVFALLILSTTVLAQTIDSSLYDEEGFLLGESSKNSESDMDTSNLTQEELGVLSSPAEINPDNAKIGELASCFDYYKFGSVDINLVQDYDKYESGDPVYIQGKITNNNSYPVIGLDIKARLVKDIPEPEYFRSEIITLEDFDIAENLILAAGEEYLIEYSHLLPLNAPSGTYQIYFYAVEQDRFNMSGLSFTNDIVASSIEFEVEGTTPDHVYLDQTQIVVGDQSHDVMAFVTQHEPGSSIPITIPLYNPSSSEIEMSVVYDLYSWDAELDSNKITSKTEIVTVPPQSEYGLSYSITDTSLPVYYLSISAQPTNQERDVSVFSQKTMSNIRLVVRGQSKPRLNFVGVNTYPLQKGTEATLVTCFHNTNNEVDGANTKIETIITDNSGTELARTVYEGNMIPSIQGLIQKFTPVKNTYEFTVTSTMYDAKGSLIDSVQKKYSCDDINPDICPQKSPVSMLITLLSIATIIGLGILLFKRKTINLIRV